MRVLRMVLGSLVWVLAGVVGLLGLVLSVTVILLPIGIPLLMLAKRLLGTAMALMLPKAAAHPVREMGKKAPDALRGGRAGRRARGKVTKRSGKSVGRAGRAVAGPGRKQLRKPARAVKDAAVDRGRKGPLARLLGR